MVKRRTYGSGSVRQLASGRWQARVRVDGERHAAPHTFDTRQAAAIWLKNQLNEIDAGTWTPPVKIQPAGKRLVFGNFAETWLAQRELKPRTRAHYRKLLDEHLLPEWGRTRMDRITVDAVETWYATLDPATPTMRAHTYALFRSILRGAWRRNLIEANPCRVEGAGSAKRASRTEIPTAEQVAALADAMPGQYRPMVLVAAWCGLRFGEITELRGGDFTRDADGLPVIVSVSRAVVKVGEEYVVGEPKSEAGVRDVVIPPHIRADLAPWVDAAGSGLVFHGRGGVHLASSSLYWHFGAARTAVGLDTLRFHDLRHFAGTMSAIVGATTAEVMARLGHSTVTASMRYQGIANGRDEEIAAALSNVVPIRKTS